MTFLNFLIDWYNSRCFCEFLFTIDFFSFYIYHRLEIQDFSFENFKFFFKVHVFRDKIINFDIFHWKRKVFSKILKFFDKQYNWYKTSRIIFKMFKFYRKWKIRYLNFEYRAAIWTMMKWENSLKWEHSTKEISSSKVRLKKQS